MNHQRVVLLVVTDLLIVAELFVAMYFAHANKERFTIVFLEIFVGLLIPTLLAYFLLRGRDGNAIEP